MSELVLGGEFYRMLISGEDIKVGSYNFQDSPESLSVDTFGTGKSFVSSFNSLLFIMLLILGILREISEEVMSNLQQFLFTRHGKVSIHIIK